MKGHTRGIGGMIGLKVLEKLRGRIRIGIKVRPLTESQKGVVTTIMQPPADWSGEISEEVIR
jgi:hypothetical protein